MIPLIRSSAPAKALLSFWNEARLCAAQAKSASVRPAPGIVPWRAALEDILKVGYGAQTQPRFLGGAWQRVRWRTTPSAGALYPFEVIVWVVGEGRYLWDVETARLVPCGLMPLTREDLAAAGFLTAPGHRVEALLILVARPWLSMKKYHQRGYAYCHLDVGHTATNLALYTSALGHTPTLHLRFSRTALAEHLRLGDLCREPMAVLSFSGTGPEPGLAEQSASLDLELTNLEQPGEQEVLNWKSLHGILSFGAPLEPPCSPTRTVLLHEPDVPSEAPVLPLPDGRPPLTAAAEWRAVILGRRSAKGFTPEPLSLAQLGELLGALRGEGLPADCQADGPVRLGVRVVARNVQGLTGVFAYSAQRHALRRVAEQTTDPRPACMQQELAADAAALVILHAPICRLVDEQGYSAFTELHFHAAQLGQRLHLAASRLANVGITCIGGFDGEQCSAFARLAGDEEAIYVILLGIPDDSAFKHDRLNVAFSHGYTTTQEEG